MKSSISVLLARKDPTIQSVTSSMTIAYAVHVMNDKKVSSVLVLDDGKLMGIFTERDVLRRVVGASLNPAKVLIREVMTSGITTVTNQTTIEEALEIFTQKVCRHLPVLDGEKVVGMISVGDVSRWLADVHRAEAEQLKNYISGGFSA